MKLKFETWLSEQINLSINSKGLFGEAIMCYKASAYKAALLFSYQGFLNILKEKILAGKKPNKFSQGLWDNKIILHLQNEDKWESEVFDATQLQSSDSKDAIFPINDSLRTQIKYWKDRRNDCAHNKNNLITDFHVESFWAFLQSNLYKMALEGSMAALIQKIQLHYNESYTPEGADISPLIKEIEYSVSDSELNEFWIQTLKIFMGEWNWIYLINDDYIKFIENVILSTNDRIKLSLISYLKQDEELLLKTISSFPKIIHFLEYSNAELRNFWYEKIFKIDNQRQLDVYGYMLNNSFIPKEEIGEANLHLISKLKYCFFPNPETIEILKNNNFFSLIDKYFFDENEGLIAKSSYSILNSRADFLITYFMNFGFNILSAKAVCNEFDKENYYSWDLRKKLPDFLSRINTRREELIKIILDNKLVIPERMKEIHDDFNIQE